MDSVLPQSKDGALLTEFSHELQRIVRKRLTCDICGVIDGPCNTVVHAAYDEMTEEAARDEMRAIEAAHAQGKPGAHGVSFDEVFSSDDWTRLAGEIERDAWDMPLGKLLAETLDFVGSGYIYYYERHWERVPGRKRRRRVMYIHCSVCSAQMPYEEDIDYEKALKHDTYCVVVQTRILVTRLLAHAGILSVS